MGGRMMKDMKKKLAYSAPIVLFCVFTFLFYGPISLYLPNAEELWFGLGELMKVVGIVSIAALLAGTIFFLILPESAGGFFRKLLFGIALGLYIQGNFINNSYGSGVLDGSEIDWSAYRGYAMINTAIWVICIILPFLISLILKKKKETFSKGLVIAALFLTVIQVPAMAAQFMSYHPNSNNELKISTEDIYEVSPEDNVFVIILDGMDEDYYQSFIEKNPAYTDELAGFVHYDNTFASGSRTMIGVPSMLTGHPFIRDVAYSEYLNHVWADKNALSALADHGYKVKVYAGALTYSAEAIDYVSNFKLNQPQVGSYKVLTKKVYKLDLFKFLPHIMKKRFWFNTTEFNQAQAASDAYRTNDPAFFQSFRESSFVVNDSLEHSFTLYHLNGAHEPYSMGADTSQVKNGELDDQVTGCFTGVKSLLDDLKEKGLYDQATIIITADHGDIQRGEHPIFLVKGGGDTKEYATSHVKASLFDLPIYLADLVDEELPDQQYGMRLSELQEGGARERHFFYNTSGNSWVVINEFATTADMDDRSSIVLVQNHEDAEGPDTPYVLGTELSFRTDATGNKYCLEGFTTNTGFRTILRGPQAEMVIPIADPPEKGMLHVHIGLHKLSKEKQYEIYCGDHEVSSGTADASVLKKGLNFEVPVSYLKDNKMELKFVFPEVPEAEMNESLKSRSVTISFVDMIID